MADCCSGPGYATPQEAIEKGPREKIVYIPCIVPSGDKADYLATAVVDPESPDYCKVVHRLQLGVGDEVHHSGWNSCASCHHDASKSRSKLILPALASSSVYIIETAEDPLKPSIHQIVKGDEINKKTGLGYPHSSHCLGSGEIMISMMGDAKGEANGNFLMLDEAFNIKGSWTKQNVPYGYDFWYQPRHNIMVSTQYGRPKSFLTCFNPEELENNYGSALCFWDWKERKLIKTLDMKPKGLIPLEIRFLHNPDSPFGFVGFSLTSNVALLYKNDDGEWDAKFVIEQEPVKVEGWAMPEMAPLITDIIISLDDKYLYFSNFFRGDICQYDISDPHNPVFVSRVWCGGLLTQGSPVKATSVLPDGLTETEIPVIKGKELKGGPQMIQISLDGKRMYATDSLLSSWDKQFYPEVVKTGSRMIQIDIDNENGGMKINPEFLVDFGEEPDGPVLAHEVRYPGGDCSSDIWV